MTRPREIRHYGRIPDVPDQRDRLYSAPAPILAALPASADLRRRCPPVYTSSPVGRASLGI
jgi:hypothetical protein